MASLPRSANARGNPVSVHDGAAAEPLLATYGPCPVARGDVYAVGSDVGLPEDEAGVPAELLPFLYGLPVQWFGYGLGFSGELKP